MKITSLVLGLAALTLVLASGWAPAGPQDGGTPKTKGTTEEADRPGERRKHPMYNDRGALDWREKLADAQKLAKRERKLIFIEYGRET